MEISKYIQMKKREYDGINQFIIDWHEEIDLGYPPMRDKRTAFNVKYPYFGQQYTKAIVNTTPFTTQKTTDKHSMANRFGPLAETGWAFGDQIHDDTLKGQMGWTKAKIFNQTDENAPTVCENIYLDLKAKLGNIILTDTYLITLEVLDADRVTETTYKGSSTASQMAMTAKSVGRHNITVTAIPDIEEILVGIDKILSHMSADFQTAYNLLYRADTSTGIRHDHLMGGAFDALTNAGIDGVKVLMVAHPEHFALTNLLFEYELNTFPSGTWQFEVSKVGYHTLLVTLTIGQGMTVHHDFMLVPITPPPTV